MATAYKIKEFTLDFKEILKQYEEFQGTLKTYFVEKNLNQVFDSPNDPSALFSIASYDFSTHIRPYIFNGKMYGEVNFYEVYPNGECGKNLKRIFIGPSGRIYLAISTDGPFDLDIDVRNLEPDLQFSNGNPLLELILLPLADDLFRLYTYE